MAELSKSQVDKLGERLRHFPHEEADLRILEEYKHSFSKAYEKVLELLHRRSLSPTARLYKTTPSIVAKLLRGDVKLSRMQDIAGCRITVDDIVEQDQLMEVLKADFPSARIKDRRMDPSHGYRAVHLIPVLDGKPVEIQIRTQLQHRWAELSEKASDVLDPEIKYGGGGAEIQATFLEYSADVAEHEMIERSNGGFQSSNEHSMLIQKRGEIIKKINDLISYLDELKDDPA